MVHNQSVPIVLSCNAADRERIANKDMICLSFNGRDVAVLKNISVYAHRKEERCCRQFGVHDQRHPYQKFIYEECGDWLVGGDLEVFERVTWADGLDDYRLTPAELRCKFKQMQVKSYFII